MRISTELYNREVLLCVICKENPSREGTKTCSLECSKAYQKAYRQTDKYKAYEKAYHKTDKYKAYQKAYHKTDKSKAYLKAYYLRNKISEGKEK